MAPRILITPTLPGAGLGAGDCARTTEQSEGRPQRGQPYAISSWNSLYSPYSLRRFEKLEQGKAPPAKPKLFPAPPAGKTKALETSKYSRRASLSAIANGQRLERGP